jgi:hypothetical protein
MSEPDQQDTKFPWWWRSARSDTQFTLSPFQTFFADRLNLPPFRLPSLLGQDGPTQSWTPTFADWFSAQIGNRPRFYLHFPSLGPPVLQSVVFPMPPTMLSPLTPRLPASPLNLTSRIYASVLSTTPRSFKEYLQREIDTDEAFNKVQPWIRKLMKEHLAAAAVAFIEFETDKILSLLLEGVKERLNNESNFNTIRSALENTVKAARNQVLKGDRFILPGPGPAFAPPGPTYQPPPLPGDAFMIGIEGTFFSDFSGIKLKPKF